MPLVVEQEGETDTCACCGHVSRVFWGLVSNEKAGVAAYNVHWTDGHLMELGSSWTVVIGKWGDGTNAADRSIVCLAQRHAEPAGFMVIDPPGDIVARYNSLAANALPRSAVIGQPVATDVFDICDAICLQNARVIAITSIPT